MLFDNILDCLVHGLSQAFQKRALPRSLMTDNGAAMKAAEFLAGLHTLGVMFDPTLPYSPYHYVPKPFMCYSAMKSLASAAFTQTSST